MVKYKDVTPEYIIENINLYIDDFLSKGFLHFKNLNPTKQQEWDIMCAIGDVVGWNPNSALSNDPIPPYLPAHDESHSVSFQTWGIKPTKDQMLIPWHMEHPHKLNPPIGVLWHMIKFECSSTSGKTYLVNMRKMFEELPEDWKSFLINSEIFSFYSTNPQGIINAESQESKVALRKIVVPHFYTKENTLRMSFFEKETIHKNKGKIVDLEETSKFIEIQNYIKNHLILDGHLIKKISWQKGDVVIADLFTMAHCVMGGFKEGTRVLSRIWCYKNHFVEETSI